MNPNHTFKYGWDFFYPQNIKTIIDEKGVMFNKHST